MTSIDAKNEQWAGTNGISEVLRDFVRHEIRENKTMNHTNRPRVLYAEDNEDSCIMVTVMCAFSEIDVVTANTVRDAWQIAQAEKFDLYLLDSRFPDGDGLELCRRLRDYAPHTAILIYSGNAYESDKTNGFAAGANGYLTKPYSEDLAATIRQTIEQTRKTNLVNRNNYSVVQSNATAESQSSESL